VQPGESEWPETPCRSLAYHRDRLEPLRITEERARVGPSEILRIRATSAAPPDVEYETFQLIGSEPSVLAVNRLLAQFVDRRGPGVSGWSRCLIAAGNVDGDYSLIVEPVRIGQSFLVANMHHDNSCGGNHPNSGSYPRIYDLSAGREVRMREWLAPHAIVRPAWADSDGEESEPNVLQLSLALRRELLRHLPRPEPQCAGVIEGTEFWAVGVGGSGFKFWPQLANVVRACGEEADLPFRAMQRYLSAEGRRAARVLASERAIVLEHHP
jgi:hypothetical protein